MGQFLGPETGIMGEKYFLTCQSIGLNNQEVSVLTTLKIQVLQKFDWSRQMKSRPCQVCADTVSWFSCGEEGKSNPINQIERL